MVSENQTVLLLRSSSELDATSDPSSSSRKLGVASVLQARGHSELELQEPDKRVWTLVLCFKRVPRGSEPKLSKATAGLTRHRDLPEADGSFLWKVNARCVRRLTDSVTVLGILETLMWQTETA